MVDIYVTQKKYNIIYADPPWEYNKRKNKNTRFGGGAGGHYDIMNLQEIRNLPVQKISENDCALFLWVTFPKLKEQLDVFESWGFKYFQKEENTVENLMRCVSELFNCSGIYQG